MVSSQAGRIRKANVSGACATVRRSRAALYELSHGTAFHEPRRCGGSESVAQRACAGSKLSLYVHIPFCQSLCWYCGCNTKVVNRYEPIERYLASLDRELAAVAALVPREHGVSHIHFGGGSPNILKAEHLVTLVACDTRALQRRGDRRACDRDRSARARRGACRGDEGGGRQSRLDRRSGFRLCCAGGDQPRAILRDDAATPSSCCATPASARSISISCTDCRTRRARAWRGRWSKCFLSSRTGLRSSAMRIFPNASAISGSSIPRPCPIWSNGWGRPTGWRDFSPPRAT